MDDGVLGIIFDAEDTAKINILMDAYETDAYNLIASVIDTIYDHWEQAINE